MSTSDQLPAADDPGDSVTQLRRPKHPTGRSASPADQPSGTSEPEPTTEPRDGTGRSYLRFSLTLICAVAVVGVTAVVADSWEPGGPYLDRAGIAAIAAWASLTAFALIGVFSVIDTLGQRQRDDGKTARSAPLLSRLRVVLLGFLSVSFMVVALIASWSIH